MQLIISEKPSVSRSIASVLGAAQKRDGYIECGGRSPADGYIISWCAGHLLELAAPEAYNEQYAKWRYADLPIIPTEWKHIPSKGKAAQLKILVGLMKRPDVDCIINACDAGREGENIFRIVYEHAKCNKPIMRLWISSMEDAAIRAGFDNLKNGADYDNLYAAASCRERADWCVGLNMTRAFTVLYGGQTLNVGRVQSPTLAMLVKREADIAAFVKEPFYTVNLDCNAITAAGDKTKNKTTAENIRAACDGQTATVTAIDRQEKSAAPPKLFDLTTLQREANRLLSFTAQQTLDYVQSLYEKQICTYPRTNSRYLTEDMAAGLPALVSSVAAAFGLKQPENINAAQVINSAKVSDHHAIIPTPAAAKSDLSALPSGERSVLNMLAARLVCAVSEKHTYTETTAVLDCGGVRFTTKGKSIINPGWKAVDDIFKASLKDKPEDDSGDDNPLPSLSEGQTFENVRAVLREGFTSPPKHYTEDTLLSSMETAGSEDVPEDFEGFCGLGTPATRAAIIEKIIKSGFMTRNKKNLLPTELGKNLIAVLPDALTSAKLTAQWEEELEKVEHGELAADSFMGGITAFTRAIVAENKTPKPEYMGLFGDTKKGASDALGTCPRCGSPVREGAKGFFCDSRDCGFKIWRDSKFWTAKKKPLTAAIVAALLKDGCVALKNLYSEKTGKKYDATVILDDTGGQYVNFKLDFGEKRTKR